MMMKTPSGPRPGVDIDQSLVRNLLKRWRSYSYGAVAVWSSLLPYLDVGVTDQILSIHILKITLKRHNDIIEGTKGDNQGTVPHYFYPRHAGTQHQ